MFWPKMDLINHQLKAIEDRISSFQFNINPLLGESYQKTLEDIYCQITEINRLLSIVEKIPKESCHYSEFYKGILNKIEMVHYRINNEFDLDWIYTEMAHEQNKTYPLYKTILKLIKRLPGDYLIIPVVCSSYQSFFIPIKNGFRHFICLPYSLGKNPLFYPVIFHELGHVYLHERKDIEIFRNVQDLIDEMEKKVKFKIQRNHGEVVVEHIKRDWNDLNNYWDFWRKELFCDSLAFHIAGPAYLFSMWEFTFPKDPFDTHISHPPLELRIQNLIELNKNLGYDKEMIESLEEKWNNCKQVGGYRPSPRFQTIVNNSLFIEVRKSIYTEIHKDESWHFDPNKFNKMYEEQVSGIKEDTGLQSNLLNRINYEWIKVYLGKIDINEATKQIIKNLT